LNTFEKNVPINVPNISLHYPLIVLQYISRRGDTVKVINIRMPDELVEKIDREVVKLQEKTPGIKMSRSDAIRHILELHFKKGAK